jgi:ornithine decarboxylase
VAVGQAKAIFERMLGHGIKLEMVNLGGGFPTKYLKQVPGTGAYANAIHDALTKHFGNALPETIIEPGRGMVGNAGVVKAEVVLISKKHANDNTRWVYLDIGKFGGLAETMDEAIRYPITTAKDGDVKEPCVIAGPTCDSADVLYEKTPYPLPITLSVGDEVLIEAAGAYTTTYAAVAFNGFPPLRSFVI